MDQLVLHTKDGVPATPTAWLPELSLLSCWDRQEEGGWLNQSILDNSRPFKIPKKKQWRSSTFGHHTKQCNQWSVFSRGYEWKTWELKSLYKKWFLRKSLLGGHSLVFTLLFTSCVVERATLPVGFSSKHWRPQRLAASASCGRLYGAYMQSRWRWGRSQLQCLQQLAWRHLWMRGMNETVRQLT